MNLREIKTIVREYTIDELDNGDKTLIEKAKEASLKAYSPYSKFSVGAAVLLETGEIIEGNNQENAAYPSGLCAERVAIFYANSMFPEVAVKAIAIIVHKNGSFLDIPIPPCGSCRQVLLETEMRFKKPIKILLASRTKISIIDNATSLLPVTFIPEYL